MTHEEAIKILAEERCKWCVFFDEEEQSCMADNGCFEATKFAIECIKKQMPKKPMITNLGSITRCPKCEAVHFQCLPSVNIDYCCRCGQAIDWSDEE